MPFMTHSLPGGGVPRVHGARSPVPAQVSHFATPRSVRHLATMLAGASPLRRPPDAWSRGLLAPPRPCYWLVASGTPMGWRGGCLAVGLVRSTVCHYCLGGCSALVVCARRSRLAWEVWPGAGSCVPPWARPCPRVPRGASCGFSRPAVPSLRLPVRHSMRSVRSAGSVRLPFGSAPRVRCVCVRSCSRGIRASPVLWVGVACTLRAVPVQDAGRPVPGGSCPSALLAAVPFSASLARRGVARSLRPLVVLWVARPPAGRPALVCWLCALWGRHQGARGGGRLLPGGWGARGRALSQPRPSVLWGVRPGPSTHWLWVRGVQAWGPVTNPTARALASWLCSRWGQHEGARGGAPLAWVWSVRGRALMHARPPVFWGVRPWPTTHWLWVWGVGARASVTNPTARALASWLCALCGRHEGAGGWRLLPVCGVSGVGRSPTPDRLSFGACGRGLLPTGCGCGVCGLENPSPTRQRALASWRCALWGRHEGARGGRLLMGVGRPRSGALPSPTARPLGRAAGAHHPLAVGAGAVRLGTRHQPHSARSRELALRAVGVAQGCLGGCASCLCVGRPGLGAPPRPDRPSFGACSWGPLPTGCACGGCGRGDPSPTPQCSLFRAGFARFGDSTRVPGGGAPCLGVGRPGSGDLPAPAARH